MAVIDVASVRVSPDTSDFRSELRADLADIDESLEVNIDLDTTEATAKFDAWVDEQGRKDINVNIDLNSKTLNNSITKALAGMDFPDPLDKVFQKSAKSGKSTFKDLSSDIYNSLLVAGDGFLNLSTESLNAMLSVGKDFEEVGKTGGEIFDSIESAGSNAGSGVADSMNSMGKSAGSALLQMGEQAAQMALQFTVMISQAYLMGSAITFAVGGATAALGAVGPALALLATPITAVLLGMDGIKAAAKTISPEFDKLRDHVSEAFLTGLKPVFAEIGDKLLPNITSGLSKTATSMSGFAKSITDAVTSSASLSRINDIFVQVQGSIAALDGPIRSFVDEIIVLTDNSDRMRTFAGLIGDVTDQFTQFLKTADGTGALTRGLDNLSTLLSHVVGLFTDLLSGALNFFNAANPGVTSFFDDIKGVIDHIDFGSLGKAFGEMLSTIGEALKSIPQATWDKLVGAFNGLAKSIGDLFADGRAQKLINFFTELVGFSASIVEFVGHLVDLASWINKTVLNIDGIPTNVDGSADATGLASGKYKSPFQNIADWSEDMYKKVSKAFGDASTAIGNGLISGLGSISSFISRTSESIKVWALGIIGSVSDAMVNFSRTIDRGANSALEFFDVLKNRIKAAFADAGSWLVASGKEILNGFLKGVEDSWHAVTDFISGIGPWIAAHKGPLSYDRALLIPAGNAIMGGLHDGLSAGFTQVQTLVAGMGPQLANSLNASGTATLVQKSVVDSASLSSASNSLSAAVVTSGATVKDRVVEAMSGWSVVMDQNGLAKLVSRANKRNGTR